MYQSLFRSSDSTYSQPWQQRMPQYFDQYVLRGDTRRRGAKSAKIESLFVYLRRGRPSEIACRLSIPRTALLHRQGVVGMPQAIDLASRVSVPKASLRVLLESEWYISASVEATVAERFIRDDEVSEKFLNSSCDDHPKATGDCIHSGRIYTAPRYAS